MKYTWRWGNSRLLCNSSICRGVKERQPWWCGSQKVQKWGTCRDCWHKTTAWGTGCSVHSKHTGNSVKLYGPDTVTLKWMDTKGPSKVLSNSKDSMKGRGGRGLKNTYIYIYYFLDFHLGESSFLKKALQKTLLVTTVIKKWSMSASTVL